MGKRLITFGVLLLWFSISFLQPASTRADEWPELALDRDGDGLSDKVETAGWRNASGGPYKTHPLNPDSDGDGLTDGEEKLFDTRPLSKASPGLWVDYKNTFKTRQYFHPTNNNEPPKLGGGPSPNSLGGGYFHWEEGGRRRILTEAVVIRRGGTFHLNAPPGASITIQKYNPNQSNLTVVSQMCPGSGWDITANTFGTVGTYTATVTHDSWTDTIPIYVIFELPKPFNGSGFNKITQADIERFLYDDRPDDRRDETAVWWLPRETKYFYRCSDHPDQPCDDEPYKSTRSFAQAFTTDQFKKYIFRERVMPAISGTNNPITAADRLATKADDEIRVWFDGLAESSFRALNRYWNGQGYIQGSLTQPVGQQGGWGCDVHAAVLSGYNRAAGILARPFQADWSSSSAIGGAGAHHGESAIGGWNDNAVLMWTNTDWRVVRAYSKQELDDPYYPWNDDGIHVGPNNISNWGNGSYSDRRSDLIVTANSSWRFSDLNTVWPPFDDASDTNGNFAKNWEYYWDSRKPFQILRNPMVQIENATFWQGDGWQPNDFSRDVYVLPANVNLNENWPYDPIATGCPPTMENCPFGNDLTSLELEAEQVPDNRLAQLSDNTLEGAKFKDDLRHSAADTDGDGDTDSLVVELGLDISKPGDYTVMAELFNQNDEWVGTATWSGSTSSARLQFEQALNQPGPYTLRSLYLMGPLGETYDARSGLTLAHLPELSASAQLGDSGGIMARNLDISAQFKPETRDPDGDGRFNSLVIKAGVTVSKAGTYRLEGWLVAANGELVAWTQGPATSLPKGKQTLHLTFDGRVISDRGLPGPYTLEEVKVRNNSTTGYNVLDKVQQTGLKLNYKPNQFETTAIFTDNMENGDGKWSSVASVWSLFEGASFSPNRAWRSNASNFQGGSLATITIDASRHTAPVLRFRSCVEAGGSANGFVEVSTNNGNTWTQVGSYATKSQNWTTKVINLNAFKKKANLKLRFRAETAGGSTLKWHIDDVRLNARPALTDVSIDRTPGGPITKPNTKITFTARYKTVDAAVPISYEWRIDGKLAGKKRTLAYTFGQMRDYKVELTVANPYDKVKAVMLVGSGTAVKGADFTVRQSALTLAREGAFNASYSPANATNKGPDHQIKYTWNFGDGSPSQTVTSASLKHTFPGSGNYLVTLSVTNNYDKPVVIKKQIKVPFDYDNDGIPDIAEWDSDQDNSTAGDLCSNKKQDTDKDGIPDCQDNDVDGDGLPNYQDTNSDGDSLLDKDEGTEDQNNNGVPDFLDRGITKTFIPMIRVK